MNENTSTCEKCGKEIHHGDFGFCPHQRLSGSVAVQDDTVTGGARYFHNLGDQPVWIEKRSELKRIMQERGLVQAERNTYNRDDKSPWATRTRLRPGQRDPFIHRA